MSCISSGEIFERSLGRRDSLSFALSSAIFRSSSPEKEVSGEGRGLKK